MQINWWRLTQRKPPTPADIKAAVKQVKQMPEAPDGKNNVSTPWGVTQDDVPAAIDWSDAKTKTVKLDELKTTAGHVSVDRDKLVWHVQNPGQSETGLLHPYVYKTASGDRVIVDGHNRLFALMLLDQNKQIVFQVKEDDAA